jgi:hypothetical protein
LNAIQALSQLSYAPHLQELPTDVETHGKRLEPRSIAEGIASVNERGLAKTSAASILQRLIESPPTRKIAADLVIAATDCRDATAHC